MMTSNGACVFTKKRITGLNDLFDGGRDSPRVPVSIAVETLRPAATQERTLCEATEEQRKHALNVAIATDKEIMERRNTSLLDEPAYDKETERMSSHLKQWIVGAEANKMEGLRSSKPRNTQKQDSLDGLNSPIQLPRRSFGHSGLNVTGDDGSLPNSPSFPTYMAATLSAKAKARSLSTPKQRVGFLDTCFDQSVRNKNGIFTWSSYNGEPFSMN